MATDFTQDTLLHFLQSRGGSVRNADLLLHFRGFIRDHEDRNHNRELFKKFVNSVATVRQVDGVSYVTLRKNFRGHVPGGGEGSTAGRSAEPSPENAKRSPAWSTEKSRQKPPQREVTAPAPAGGAADKTVLPAAGIMLINNNNNVETNLNLKQVVSTPGPPGRPAADRPAADRPAAQTPRMSEPPAPEQSSRVGQHRVEPGLPPPGVTPGPPGRPAAGRPAADRPAADRPAAGRPAADRPAAGLPAAQTPRMSEPPAPEQSSRVGQHRVEPGLPPPGVPPVVPAVRPHGEPIQEVQVPETHGGRLHHHAGVQLQDAPRRIRHRKSYKSAVSYDEDEEEEEEVHVRPLSAPLQVVGRTAAASSPSVTDPSAPASPERKLPKIYIQDAEGETLPPGGPGWHSESGQRGRWEESAPTRRSLPVEAERHLPSPERPRRDVHADRRSGMDPRLGAIYPSSSEAEIPSSDRPPPGSPRGSGWNSRHEDQQTRAGQPGGGAKIQEVLQSSQETNSERHGDDGKTTEPWHHSTGHLHDDREAAARLSPLHQSADRLHGNQTSMARVSPWHLSTGDLYDDREEAESSDGSTSSPPPRLRPAVARRLSSQLRSRMCRSLGADLDQLLQEEERAVGGSEAARLNRLHMISSSLSLRYNLSSSSLSSCSTPPRCHSFADLTEAVEEREGRRRSSPVATITSSPPSSHHVASSRQSLVPLEPREHAWLVKAAAGAWPDIYTLFREDSSLLNRQDFISGFTVLHWIAKHGDHRVLNTLWYGVQKAGLTFDINAKSTCGHTPLHIAAIHGNRNMIRLLVNKFKADVTLRDTAGKKPWQYLSRATAPDVLQLLGAPLPAGKGDGGDPGSEQRPKHRRRRHHLSFASASRPLSMTGTTRVKRSSSIAAFLKHKSMIRFHGHQSDTSL